MNTTVSTSLSFARAWLQPLAVVVALAMAASPASAGFITLNNAQMNTVFSQVGFGTTPIDIRFNAAQTLNNPSLQAITSAAKWTTLVGLAPDASPTVNMFFVDSISFCSVPAPTAIGCGQTPGNVIAVDSNWAANATYGTNLMSHELGHNLALAHITPDNGTNLMNPTISTSFALTAAQIATILASGLVQTDIWGDLFIAITPIAVVPEPSTVVLLAGGLIYLGSAVARARRAQLGH